MNKKLKLVIPILVIVILIFGTSILVPKIIENYKFEKAFEANLKFLADRENNESNEYTSNIKNEEYNIPLTFEIKEEYEKTDEYEMYSYKIIPSYNKDFSKWTKEEKEAYNTICQQANAMAEARHNEAVQKEKDEISAIQEMLNEQMANDWETENYESVGYVQYNDYNTIIKGAILGQAFEVSYQEFVDSLGPSLVSTMYSKVEYGRQPDGSYSELASQEEFDIAGAIGSVECLIENLNRVIILKNTPDGEEPPF